MVLRFKIGTHPVFTHDVPVIPAVGSRIDLPYPTGGVFDVKIDRIQFTETGRVSDALFFGE